MILQKPGNFLKRYRTEMLILLFFFILYSAISLVNHYNLRTAALDLGMFNHALYSFAHGKMNYFTLDLSGNSPNYFADHFSPITLLYVPFYYIFGSWTLLIIQIVSILFGAWGCYLILKLKIPHFKYAKIILIFFLFQWGIISALAFDFHNNVVAAMLVPWMIYYYLKDERWKVLVFLGLILITKENVALWMSFVFLGLILSKGFKELKNNYKNYLKWEVPLLLICFLYFYLVVSVVMPYLSQGQAVNQIARFGQLGDSVGEIIISMLKHPIDTIKMFFASNSKDPVSFGIKMELHRVVLISGGFALFLRPAYLVMLIPIYLQKLLSDNMAMWGINGQYSIEFTPIITLAMIDLLSRMNEDKWRKILLYFSTFFVIAISFITLRERKSFWYDYTVHDFTRKAHYTSGDLDLKFVYQEINKIPDKVPISVTSCLAPHLFKRDKLYHFPIIKDAEYVVLIKTLRSTYPIPSEDLEKHIDQLKQNDGFKVVVDKNDLLILKRPSNKQ